MMPKSSGGKIIRIKALGADFHGEVLPAFQVQIY